MRRPDLITSRVHDGRAVCFHTTHIGEDFPVHLQVAFGRGVFKLLHWTFRNRGRTAYGLTPGLIYLRDLPLNLADLDRRGYPAALVAYRAECQRTGRGNAI